jgi:hypothetical protein
MALTRRQVLVGGGVVGGVLAAGGLVARRTATAITTATFIELADLLPRIASVRDLGVEYLRRAPEEADEARLPRAVRAILSRTSLAGGLEQMRERFFEQERSDFERGDVVRIDGWLLSRTSLRLCAIAVARAQDHVGMTGVFAPQDLGNGDAVSWTTPDATFTLPQSDEPVDIRLRSGAPFAQRVVLTVDGDRWAEIAADGPTWQSLRYTRAARPGRGRLGLRSSPPWVPGNDFRTLGVGVGLAPWSTWATGA